MAEAEYAFRNISTHPVDLADGTIVATGEFCLVPEDQMKDAHNEDLIASGHLLAVDDLADDERKKATRRVKRREAKQGDELTLGEVAPDAQEGSR